MRWIVEGLEGEKIKGPNVKVFPQEKKTLFDLLMLECAIFLWERTFTANRKGCLLLSRQTLPNHKSSKIIKYWVLFLPDDLESKTVFKLSCLTQIHQVVLTVIFNISVSNFGAVIASFRITSLVFIEVNASV